MTKEAGAPAPKKTTKKPVEARRNMGTTETVYHDLFLLEIAETMKNVSWTDSPRYEPVVHKHFYHSCDSDGRKLDKSVQSAGHFHQVKWKTNEETGEMEAECGPPMVWHKGKPYPYKNDKHTHTVKYLWSEEVERRKRNAAAATSMALLASDEQRAIQNAKGITQ